MRTLQTSRSICQNAINTFSPMELNMCADGWIALDAMAAHDLLDLLIKCSENLDPDSEIYQDIEEWL